MLDKEFLQFLSKQKETEYKYEDVNKLEVAHKLIENIGDLDPEVRDGLIYPCLAHLLHDKHFDESQLEEITRLLISYNYLLFDLDNDIEYSVLIRSFTLLQLVIIVFVHNRDNIISDELIKEILVVFLEYYDKEENLKGYQDNVGFMHSIAHSADLFAQLVKVEKFKEAELKVIFSVIAKKFKRKDYFFQHDEDERTVNAIHNALERDILDDEFLLEWVNALGSYPKVTDYPEAYNMTNNIKNLLRSLYFRVLDNEKYDFLSKEIAKVLKEKVKLS